ncbi:MAG: bacillithiol biosynthesis deacetylase BshB1 [Deltaproteobacteria bacterium]|nr:bacillithiol biosynthesis deacetylase BshB1 [Deltaproteobacteria bacterium]
MKPIDILVFSPHPDDAEIGCAGTILLETDRGRRVAIADLTDGECAGQGSRKQRNREREKAAALMGLADRISLKLPDTQIGSSPEHRLVLIEAIRKTRPKIILAPYEKDRHPDHEGTSRLVREAFFYAGVEKVHKGKAYRPAAIYTYMIHTPFMPSFVIDISSVWERKQEIIKAYRSQFTGGKTAIGKPDFLHYLEARSRFYGAHIGALSGEPFFCEGPLGLDGLPKTASEDTYKCCR